MDAFFVNVHVLGHPEDAGLPLAVGGSPAGRGVVAAASYEARRFGVHSAMPSRRAAKLCPDLKFVGHDWSRIKRCSRQVMAILGEYGPLEPMSVDEAYVDLAGTADPPSLARRIRRRVRDETGLPASVGLATCKLVAKVASDFDKPEGFTVVAPGTEAAFLAPLPVRALHGIGPVTERRLKKLGLTTCHALASADPLRVARAAGRQADDLIRMAQGIDPRPVMPPSGPPKSVSTETTFDRDVADRAELESCLRTLVADVASTLARQGLVARTVFVKLRRADFTTFTRQRTLDVVVDREPDLQRAGLALFRQHWDGGRLRLLGFGVAKLSDGGERQMPLDL